MISEYVNLMKEIIESDIEKRIINIYVENNKDAIFNKINNLVEEELGNKPSSHFTDAPEYNIGKFEEIYYEKEI